MNFYLLLIDICIKLLILTLLNCCLAITFTSYYLLAKIVLFYIQNLKGGAEDDKKNKD